YMSLVQDFGDWKPTQPGHISVGPLAPSRVSGRLKTPRKPSDHVAVVLHGIGPNVYQCLKNSPLLVGNEDVKGVRDCMVELRDWSSNYMKDPRIENRIFA